MLVSSEAAVLPGGEEQGDWGSASENRRAGRDPAGLQPQRRPSEEEKDIICLEANELLICQLCGCTGGAEVTEMFLNFQICLLA